LYIQLKDFAQKHLGADIYIQQFLDCHAADFTEEYLEQLTVQVKQKIKILMLLWSCLSSEERRLGQEFL